MLFSEQLPAKTVVNRVIPKNAFDSYTDTRQKKQMVELVERIRWTNKLSLETVNVSGKEIKEIQIFEVELRGNHKITDLLQVIDKAIPYHIIFQLNYEGKSLISVSKKHHHPGNENTAVIDWTFATNWFDSESNSYTLKLERSLDYIFLDFCRMISGRDNNAKTIEELIAFEAKADQLMKSINKVKSRITMSKQFNRRVELNVELNKIESQLDAHLKNQR